MIERRQDQFGQVKHKAEMQMLNPYPNESYDDYDHLLSIIRQPSFSDSIGIHLLQNNASDVVIYQTVWQTVFDKQRFFDPLLGLKWGWDIAPTMDYSITHVQYSEIKQYMENVQTIRVPSQMDEHVTLDGIRWTVKLPIIASEYVYSWNGGTNDLKEWTKGFYHYLVELVQ